MVVLLNRRTESPKLQKKKKIPSENLVSFCNLLLVGQWLESLSLPEFTRYFTLSRLFSFFFLANSTAGNINFTLVA